MTADLWPAILWAYLALASSTLLVGSYIGLSKLLVAALPVLLLAWLRFCIAAVSMAHWVRRTPAEAPLSPRDRRLLFWAVSWATSCSASACCTAWR